MVKNQWFFNDFCFFQGLVIFVVLEPVLERFRSQLGAILEPFLGFWAEGWVGFGLQKSPKTIVIYSISVIWEGLFSEVVLRWSRGLSRRLLGGSWADLGGSGGGSWSRFGAVLGVLGPSWDVLGPSSVGLGPYWRCLGAS